MRTRSGWTSREPSPVRRRNRHPHAPNASVHYRPLRMRLTPPFLPLLPLLPLLRLACFHSRASAEHPWFRAPAGQAALHRVLLSVARHRSAPPSPSSSSPWEGGYCQSMNFVAGFLLLVMRGKGKSKGEREGRERVRRGEREGEREEERRAEERAFWTMVAMIEDRVSPDTWSAHLKGTLVEMKVRTERISARSVAPPPLPQQHPRTHPRTQVPSFPRPPLMTRR